MIANNRTFIRRWTCIAAAILLLFAASSWANDDSAISVGGGTLCTDIPRFALCTSAPCQFDKNDPKTLVCDCVVATGSNWGKNTCEERMPRGTELCSNFSPIQAGEPLNLKALVCDNEQTWASCLDAPCTVDPNDPTKAKCKCPVATDTPWLTFGGNCDQAECSKFWSAAPTVDGQFQKVLDAFASLEVPGSDYPMCK